MLQGDLSRFEPLILRYQPRLFGMARRYARRPDEVEDIVQEIFIKAFHKLSTYRREAPFEHWLMRLAVRTCYDFLRAHQRRRETNFTDFTETESDWLDRFASDSTEPDQSDVGARELLSRALEMLPPPARLVLTLLEIEQRSVREIADLTGWSQALVKVRAFRARKLMRKKLESMLKTRNPFLT